MFSTNSKCLYLHRFIVDHSRKLAYCGITKTGCTTWKLVLANNTLNGPQVKTGNDSTLKWIHTSLQRYSLTNEEYSANLESRADIQALCAHLRTVAATIDALPMPGIRVRAIRCDHYSIADGNPKHAFIDISVRLRAGRTDDVKRNVAERLFATAKDFLKPVLATSSLALSLEMRDIDPDLSPKTGTIRDHLQET